MKTKQIKTVARVLLGTGLVFAGVGHLTFARNDFRAQVPDWVPLDTDDTVVYSGITEIALGTALILSPKKTKKIAGKIAAGFFIAVFPGNISQYAHHRRAFGLDTDGKRLGRLFLQPLLVYWALKSTQ
jgi:uncharacterized membrane protein